MIICSGILKVYFFHYIMSRLQEIGSFALLLPVYHLFDYQLEEVSGCTPGMRFILPFGQGKKVGILLSSRPSQADDRSNQRIKPARQLLDRQPLVSKHLLELATWLADYYCQPLGEVVFHCIPRYARRPNTLTSTQLQCWAASEVSDENLQYLRKKAKRQFEILQMLLKQKPGMSSSDLKAVNKNWRNPVNALVEKGWVKQYSRENLPESPTVVEAPPSLTQDQRHIVDEIEIKTCQFGVHVIQGVTGSGKTEIYLTLIQQMLEMGRQVIYLVPEIGLTPQLLSRLRQRFGSAVVTSHSAQTDFQRYQSWDQFKRGAARVMSGTRSALFSDAESLGMIIIDEEHDASYRQQDGLRYNARDVAIKRAHMLNIPILLGSATPSLETLHNSHKTHYQLYRLDQRVNKSLPPPIELLDCSQIPMTSGCSPQLLAAMKKHLASRGQVLLFLNRRGFAPVVMCHGCGWRAGCYQCDARLTLHQSINKLICHHCGYSTRMPDTCPQCHEAEIKHYGVGTEQLENFLKITFPDIRIIRIDRDSVSASHHIEHMMQPVMAGDPCILIGTQMLAKGHDYPHITLVGILDADQALHSSFYRAAERLIQTVLQVSGRAGRAEKKGQALLQTAFPAHPLMSNLCHQTYSELVLPILQERKTLQFPPFSRVVTFQVDAVDLDQALEKLEKIKSFLPGIKQTAPLRVVGPLPALMTRRVGRYRAQLSLMANNVQTIRRVLQQLMPRVKTIRNTQKSRLTIEVDPLDL